MIDNLSLRVTIIVLAVMSMFPGLLTAGYCALTVPLSSTAMAIVIDTFMGMKSSFPALCHRALLIGHTCSSVPVITHTPVIVFAGLITACHTAWSICGMLFLVCLSMMGRTVSVRQCHRGL